MSVCSLPCGAGHRRRPLRGLPCCWICEACSGYHFQPDAFSCQPCGFGLRPAANASFCAPIPVAPADWGSPWFLVPVFLASVGFLSTGLVAAAFVRHRDTPIVRASGRELSYLVLAGVFLCYVSTFLLVAPPGVGVCGFRRVFLGLGLCVIYAALLTKTNRIYRIFEQARRSAAPPRLISPASQVGVAAGLVAVQLMGALLWLGLDPPRVVVDYERPEDPARARGVPRCDASDLQVICSLGYSILLMVTCTVYAIRTRGVPESFNEAKPIGLTMYTTCIVWLAFIPIFFTTSQSAEKLHIQACSLAVCVALSGWVALALLFLPKLYVLLLRPQLPAPPRRALRAALSRRGGGQRPNGEARTELVQNPDTSEYSGDRDRER
ncbi:metabotropic glutamate receptor 7-like, partial [Menidia menidia]